MILLLKAQTHQPSSCKSDLWDVSSTLFITCNKHISLVFLKIIERKKPGTFCKLATDFLWRIREKYASKAVHCFEELTPNANQTQGKKCHHKLNVSNLNRQTTEISSKIFTAMVVMLQLSLRPHKNCCFDKLKSLWPRWVNYVTTFVFGFPLDLKKNIEIKGFSFLIRIILNEEIWH